MTTTIYQTIELREGQTKEEILALGPFKCTRSDAWLGDGYYFWDSNIELAHAWGEKVYKGKYVICEAEIYAGDKCFNLTHIPHQNDFNETLKWLIDNHPKHKYHVPIARQVFSQLEENGLREDFEGIRLKDVFSFYGLKSKIRKLPKSIKMKNESDPKKDNKWRMKIHEEHIQISLFEKDSLGFKNYKVVYPKNLT